MRFAAKTFVAACGACFAMACGDRAAPDVLLFTGAGTSPNDAAAIESILDERHIHYSTANSRQLAELDATKLQAYRLFIVPGGNFVEMGNGMTVAATTAIRDAIASGLNYLGICAGAFMAGNSPYNGLNITGGVQFRFYSAESQGIRKAPVKIETAAKVSMVQYWEDGPALSGWGDVIAKYPDGMPAIVEGQVGSGMVILVGTHPEAPDSWRKGMAFGESASVSREYTGTLIEAALNRTALAHF